MKRLIVLTAVALITVAAVPVFAGPPDDGDRQVYVHVSGDASRAFLGVNLRDLNAKELDEWKDPDDLGAYVVKVTADSPAAKAGLAEGDIIVRYAGIPVLGVTHLTGLVRATPPGKTVSIEIARGGKRQTLQATLGKRDGDYFVGVPGESLFTIPEMPKRIPDEFKDYNRTLQQYFVTRRPRLGIFYDDLTDQLAKFFGVPEGKGVLITSVAEDSPAAKAGLAAGDVIVAIGDSKVTDSGDLMRALSGEEDDGTLAVKIYRKGKAMDVRVTLDDDKPELPKARKLSV
ncbi:MAG TPA: PDZ domain-containing protein [Acidobacteriota bacterium]|nr:PDZ domain-containing protein [Acidobacteriota bacterium]HQF86934.1 PDZ domain-containing protein [Acidobacteriota bacterium]HQG91268.1 PDZ domain-containing protein [Acidobacteriota bacterium]HQK87070.1 PDZ domain-containing protein [Acidobacteriota bacterium]